MVNIGSRIGGTPGKGLVNIGGRMLNKRSGKDERSFCSKA